MILSRLGSCTSGVLLSDVLTTTHAVTVVDLDAVEPAVPLIPPKPTGEAQAEDTDDCQTALMTVAEVQTSTESPRLVPALDGCMVIDGSVAEHACRVLLDTGASHSHISQSFVQRHALTTQRMACYANGLMANGTQQRIDRVLRAVSLSISGRTEAVDLLVMPMYNFDVILGMDWHRAHEPVTYSSKQVSYQCGEERVLLYCSTQLLAQMNSCMISATQLQQLIKRPNPAEMYVVFVKRRERHHHQRRQVPRLLR